MSPKERATDSLKKAMMRPATFDEASYYKSEKVEMGGEDDTDDLEQDFEDDDEDEDGEGEGPDEEE